MHARLDRRAAGLPAATVEEITTAVRPLEGMQGPKDGNIPQLPLPGRHRGTRLHAAFPDAAMRMSLAVG
jgi:hypothetical protein